MTIGMNERRPRRWSESERFDFYMMENIFSCLPRLYNIHTCYVLGASFLFIVSESAILCTRDRGGVRPTRLSQSLLREIGPPSNARNRDKYETWLWNVPRIIVFENVKNRTLWWQVMDIPMLISISNFQFWFKLQYLNWERNILDNHTEMNECIGHVLMRFHFH